VTSGILDLQVTGRRFEPSKDSGILLEIVVVHANKLADIILNIVNNTEDVFGSIEDFSNPELQSVGANRFLHIVANIGSLLVTTYSPQAVALPFVDIGIAIGTTWSDNDLFLLDVVSVNHFLLHFLGEVETSVKDAILQLHWRPNIPGTEYFVNWLCRAVGFGYWNNLSWLGVIKLVRFHPLLHADSPNFTGVPVRSHIEIPEMHANFPPWSRSLDIVEIQVCFFSRSNQFDASRAPGNSNISKDSLTCHV